jgi:hypothetical protein
MAGRAGASGDLRESFSAVAQPHEAVGPYVIGVMEEAGKRSVASEHRWVQDAADRVWLPLRPDRCWNVIGDYFDPRVALSTCPSMARAPLSRPNMP